MGVSGPRRGFSSSSYVAASAEARSGPGAPVEATLALLLLRRPLPAAAAVVDAAADDVDAAAKERSWTELGVLTKA